MERARDPDEHEQRVDRQHRGRGVARLEPQQERAYDLRQLTDAHDAASIEAIRGLSREKIEHDPREELSKSDEPKIERPVRQLVNLPTDRDACICMARTEDTLPRSASRKSRCRNAARG
jgi:hypothetical protein